MGRRRPRPAIADIRGITGSVTWLRSPSSTTSFTKNWRGKCYQISYQCVERKLVKGVAVYGHWLGRVHPDSMFFSGGRMPFCRHGWVILDDGRIFDPTRWVFEAVKPYLYVGPGDAKEYDEGGTQWRLVTSPPIPKYSADEKQVPMRLPILAWQHVVNLLHLKSKQRETKVLSYSQARWLANADYVALEPFAKRIYDALKKVGHQGLVPIDNWRRAHR
jgi:hypothetical protein